MTDRLSTHRYSTTRTTGDAAVDGLIIGIVAGIAMAGAVAIMALAMGEALTTMFSRFSTPSMDTPVLLSILGHLAISGIYGAVFGVLWHYIAGRVSRLAALVAGLLYSLVLFVAAMLFVLPAAQSPMLDIPVQFALAHLVYGVVLGALFGRP